MKLIHKNELRDVPNLRMTVSFMFLIEDSPNYPNSRALQGLRRSDLRF